MDLAEQYYERFEAHQFEGKNLEHWCMQYTASSAECRQLV